MLKVWNLDYNLPDESSIDNNSQTYTAIAHLLTEHVNTFPNNDLDKEFFHRKQLRYLAQLLYLETTMHESPTIRIYISNNDSISNQNADRSPYPIYLLREVGLIH